MKKAILLIVLLLASACVSSGGNEPKQTCNVQYSTSGVALSQLKPDYAKAYVGGSVRYNLEVTNFGEKRATNINVKCTDDSELSCPTAIFNNLPFDLNPPDPTACIEGDAKQEQIIVNAQKQTGEEPAYFKVKLSYDYSSTSWAEVTLVSETQWRIRTQQGVKPVQNAYKSATPIQIEIGVPDAPVVYAPPPATNEFPVTIVLRNAVAGYSCSQTSGADEDKVDSVVLNAPSGLAFVKEKCNEIVKGGAKESQTCTLSNLAVTTEDDNPRSTLLKLKITSPVAEEEIYKITAEAKYTYVVKYASPQGVEIKTEYVP